MTGSQERWIKAGGHGVTSDLGSAGSFEQDSIALVQQGGYEGEVMRFSITLGAGVTQSYFEFQNT